MVMVRSWMNDAVERAWHQIARDLSKQYPGSDVRYNGFGLVARIRGREVGPTSWGGMKAALANGKRRGATGSR